jgi:hypothetical protein
MPVNAEAIAVCTNAVEASCAVLVVPVAVGAVGTPVKAGEAKSALEEIAEAIAIYSVSISVPLTILLGSPEPKVSLVVKLVAFV